MYINTNNPEHRELRAYVSPTAQKLETLLKSADKMPFTTLYPPKRRTVKAYLSSLRRYQKDQARILARSYGMTLPEYERLQDKAGEILSDFHTGHSMGCTASLKINGKAFARLDRTDNYARSCTWKPTHGHFSIDLSKAALKRIEKTEGAWTYNGQTLNASGHKSTYKVELI